MDIDDLGGGDNGDGETRLMVPPRCDSAASATGGRHFRRRKLSAAGKVRVLKAEASIKVGLMVLVELTEVSLLCT